MAGVSPAGQGHVRFALFGGPRVWRGDIELDAGRPHRRVLLALLLAAGCEPITMSQVLAAVWSGDPPPTAVNIVHRLIGELRRLLEPDLGAREVGSFLLPAGLGYRLRLDPDDSDVLRLRRLVADGSLEALVEAVDLVAEPPASAVEIEAAGPSPFAVLLEQRAYVTLSQNPLDASWARNPDGTINSGLLTDFSSRSVHDMTVVAKGVTNAFYGTPVTYSYWNGCSTGGRQGYAEAQQYPTDYDGILAGAPAINWDRFAIATLWPQVVFNEEHVAPTQCELAAFTTAAVNACDTLDGVRDGIIDDPQRCAWDPRSLVGTKVVCDGQTVTITAAEADAVAKIWAGPVAPDGQKLWYGPNIGADFGYLANAAQPFFVADSWAKYFLTGNPSLDTTKLTYASYASLFAASRQYAGIIGTDDPDLSKFRTAGGKLLSWQGQADQLVPTQGTVDYRNRVEQLMGGNAQVDDFYRLFLLPGVAHCGGGSGPQPTDPLGALVSWVESGRAPATLATATKDPVTGRTIARNACPYPQVAHYTGHGQISHAASYRCASA
jgi:Tannase and feruloyl esterase